MKISVQMREYLSKRPTLFKGYAKFLNITTKTLIYSLDHLMKHSAVINNVDLEDPWKHAKEYLEQNFDTIKDKEFFIPTYMEVVYNQIKDPSISKENFYKLTNLSGVNDCVCKCQDCIDKSPTRKAVKKTTKKVVKNPKIASKKTSTAKGRTAIRKDLIKAAQSK